MSRPPEAGTPPPGRRERVLAEDELPASVGQLKSLRRWLIVAGVWAVAATALAVFALIEANKEDEASREQVTGQLGRVQSQLSDRIADLERRVERLPTSQDVQNLDDRLSQVEEQAGRTNDRLEELTGRVDELERNLNDLEEQVAQNGGGTETTP